MAKVQFFWLASAYLLLVAFSVNANQQQLEQALMAEQQQLLQQQQQAINQLASHPETTTADLWRAVRAGQTGETPATTYESGRLINAIGNQGRLLRQAYIEPLLSVALFGVFCLFLIFYFVNGPAKLTKGFSGKLVRRWSDADLVLHWLMAVSCLLLMLTGIVIMLGRHIIEPWLPDSAWAGLILGCKTIHDWTGPIFIVTWLACILKWMPLQTFKGYDFKWFLTAGGYINFGPLKGKHADSGFANAGEKLWFWTLVFFGLFISASGILLVFPEIQLSREVSIIALLIHGVSAAILIGFTIVHIWMATALSEGGLESMVSGYCDENWAVQHHNIWYKDIKREGKLQYKT